MTTKIESWLLSTAFILSTFTLVSSIELSIAIAVPTKQEPKPTGLIDRLKLIFSFHDGANKDRPRVSAAGRRTRVAGSRDICKADIVALIPSYNLGVTASRNPTFWFYLPPSAIDAESLEFSVFDREQKEIWSQQLSSTSKQFRSGLLKIPYQGRPLADGDYQWAFSYREPGCDRTLLTGKVQKESHPNLVVGKTPRERLYTYARNGIWYELLTELIMLRQQQPQDLQLAADFRSLIFESETIKYYRLKSLPTDPTTEDRDLMEKIVSAVPIE
jgi:Domain of Unknown Function (DUF928)